MKRLYNRSNLSDFVNAVADDNKVRINNRNSACKIRPVGCWVVSMKFDWVNFSDSTSVEFQTVRSEPIVTCSRHSILSYSFIWFHISMFNATSRFGTPHGSSSVERTSGV